MAWDANVFIDEAISKISSQIGNKKAVCGLSGGVDSSVAAVLVAKAVPGCLTGIYVNTGLMRLDETEEVRKSYEDMGIPIIYVNAEDYFLEKLKGVTEPETKRKIVGEGFIRIFEQEAKKLGPIDFLVQGTIYPDVLESEKGQKTHHNVGGLPEVMGLALCEPLYHLYKYEVREVGLALGMPGELINRQPFPGPGLSVRCLGEVNKEKLDLLRRADFIVRDEIKNAGLAKSIWQYMAILTDLRSTGIRDEKRVYGHVIAVRAVNSHDTSHAEWYKMPLEVLAKLSSRITKEMPEVARVVYDITDKPVGTIEWE